MAAVTIGFAPLDFPSGVRAQATMSRTGERTLRLTSNEALADEAHQNDDRAKLLHVFRRFNRLALNRGAVHDYLKSSDCSRGADGCSAR